MKKYELNNRFVIFGSKEDVWANKVHIRYQNGEKGTSLCGKFSRAENLAEIRKESDITCKTCIDLYKKQWRKATPFESDVLAFLNGLREEGTTNMFGASPILAEMFDLNKKQARNLLSLWMENFNNQVDYIYVYDKTKNK
jgi:hypothetical protein